MKTPAQVEEHKPHKAIKALNKVDRVVSPADNSLAWLERIL